MALMLRYLGIPPASRQASRAASMTAASTSGDVTDHDAHTWVEAWFPRYGLDCRSTDAGPRLPERTYTSSSPRFDLRWLFAVTQN